MLDTNFPSALLISALHYIVGLLRSNYARSHEKIGRLKTTFQMKLFRSVVEAITSFNCADYCVIRPTGMLEIDERTTQIFLSFIIMHIHDGLLSIMRDLKTNWFVLI